MVPVNIQRKGGGRGGCSGCGGAVTTNNNRKKKKLHALHVFLPYWQFDCKRKTSAK